MPSIILYKLFPIFRVLSRLGVIILLVELIYMGYGLQFYLGVLKKLKVRTSIAISSMIPFIIICLMEFFIPLRITLVKEVPTVYRYLKDNTPEGSVIAVYPYSKSIDVLFRINDFDRPLVNSPNFDKPEVGFYSETFTNNLGNCEGLKAARALGVDYLIYFYRTDEGNNLEHVFSSMDFLELSADFSYNKDDSVDLGKLNYYVKVVDKGNTASNSALVYKFLEDFDYLGYRCPVDKN